MAAKLLTISLLFALFSQGLTWPTSDVTNQNDVLSRSGTVLSKMYDVLSNMMTLYGDYKNVRQGFQDKRDKCLKISDAKKREKCLKNVEEQEKPAYQKITDSFRSLANEFVTETKGFFTCIAGL